MENAKVGLGKLFIAEILFIISSLGTSFLKEYMYLAIAFALLSVVAFFMNLRGLKLMAKDLEGYKKAYNFAWVGIAVDVITIILYCIVDSKSPAGVIINNTEKALSSALEFSVAYLVLKASIDYLKDKGNKELGEFANKTKNMLVFAYAVAILVDMFIPSDVVSWIALVLIVVTLAAAICLLVGQIRYIIFLKRMEESL